MVMSEKVNMAVEWGAVGLIIFMAVTNVVIMIKVSISKIILKFKASNQKKKFAQVQKLKAQQSGKKHKTIEEEDGESSSSIEIGCKYSVDRENDEADLSEIEIDTHDRSHAKKPVLQKKRRKPTRS